ncbi:hypothetical protein KC317_g23541, partial [Hortaea werneckii]
PKARAAPKTKTGSSSSAKPGPKQQGIASFFQKRAASASSNVTPAKRASDANGSIDSSKVPTSSADRTPVPSSSVAASSSPPAAPGASQQTSAGGNANKENETPGTLFSSPSRKAKKQVNYAESDDEDDDEVFKPLSGNRRASKRRRISAKDESDDEYGFDEATQAAMESDD